MTRDEPNTKSAIPFQVANGADAELLTMIKRHELQWTECGRLDEDDPRLDEVSSERVDLAFQIVITPAHTPRGLAGKRRVISLEELEDNQGFFDWVLARDAERIAAGKAGRHRAADNQLAAL